MLFIYFYFSSVQRSETVCAMLVKFIMRIISVKSCFEFDQAFFRRKCYFKLFHFSSAEYFVSKAEPSVLFW